MRHGQDCPFFIQLKNCSGNFAEVTLSKYISSKAVDVKTSNSGSAVEADDAIPPSLSTTVLIIIPLIRPKQASSMATSPVTSGRKLRYVVHELTNTVTASLVSYLCQKKKEKKIHAKHSRMARLVCETSHGRNS